MKVSHSVHASRHRLTMTVVKCRPKLDPEELAQVVDRLNETRRFSLFLKEVRALFKKQAVGE